MWNERIAAVEADGLPVYSAQVVERWFGAPFKERAPLEVRGYRNMVANIPEQGYLGTCVALREADYREAVREIGVPAIAIAGEHDVAATPDAMADLARSIPDCRYEVIPGSGHIPCVEQPDYLVEVLRAFLADAEIN